MFGSSVGGEFFSYIFNDFFVNQDLMLCAQVVCERDAFVFFLMCRHASISMIGGFF